MYDFYLHLRNVEEITFLLKSYTKYKLTNKRKTIDGDLDVTTDSNSPSNKKQLPPVRYLTYGSRADRRLKYKFS